MSRYTTRFAEVMIALRASDAPASRKEYERKNMAFIETKDLEFGYTGDDGEYVPVINGINLSIEKGEFIAIIGRNGSGKSTLAKLLNMVLEAKSGSVTVDGTQLTPEISDEDLLKVRRKVGMVFQNPDNQLVATVVEEDIAFGPENLGLDPDEIRARVDGALASVGMSKYAKHSPTKLSGGQKQRIAIAGILALMPECVIFDEATAMLDPAGRKEVMDIITKLNRSYGITVLHITHNMEEAVLAERVIVIDHGRVLADGTPRRVFSDYELLSGAGLALPQTTELFGKLRKAGISLPADALTEDEGFEILLKALKNR